jgi:hypothetical protein
MPQVSNAGLGKLAPRIAPAIEITQKAAEAHTRLRLRTETGTPVVLDPETGSWVCVYVPPVLFFLEEIQLLLNARNFWLRTSVGVVVRLLRGLVEDHCDGETL